MDPAVDRLLTLKIKDVMTRHVVCVSADQTADAAALTFNEKGISGAPVVDGDGRCVGVLSATDYVAQHPDPGTQAATVADLMSSGVRAVSPEQTLLAAARMMCIKHVHRLPVLDGDNKPVGLITAMDVVAALVNAIDEREAAAL